jgi:hypothetical protein
MQDVRKLETRIQGSSDPFWWGVAALLSLGSLWVPRFLSEQSETTRIMVVASALFFTGALLGGMRPRRVWRWSVACFVTIALRDLVWAAYEGKLPNAEEITAYATSHSEIYLLYSAVVLVGALLGALMTRAGLE